MELVNLLMKGPSRKMSLGLSGLALITAVESCDLGYRELNFKPDGIYKCRPKEGQQGQTYRFDSGDSRTVVWFGQNRGIEFYDQISGEVVRLYENSNLPYNCECIQPKEESNAESTKL
ncbi:hypothetical protein HYW21_02850 [Candidatus Woesearchaeota archaeon]|nr:hypothetical protein [Candidatus Woesearchaeota archaeon]